MTTANSTKNAFRRGHVGTLSALAWTGDPEAGHNMPYLLVYSLGDGVGEGGGEGVGEGTGGADGDGDGDGGTEAGEAALRALIEEIGLKAGAEMTDATSDSVNSPIRLLVEGGQATLTMPRLSAQCPAPPEWLAAADERGHAHVMVAARPWPEAVPGAPVTEEMLQAFLGDEETFMACGHVLLPVSRLRR
ncbi:DUF5949 family protein [Streptomyces sp. NPDC055078]